jgi:hypothetical protein
LLNSFVNIRIKKKTNQGVGMIEKTLTIHDDIQRAYQNSISRLGLSAFSLEVEGERHPIDVITHPYVLLARMAMRAEESSLLVFGVRLFPDACFIANNETPTGMVIQEVESLTDRQLMEKNIQEALQKPSASEGSMTIGHRELLIDSSVVDTLEIDKEAKVVKIKPHNFIIQHLFREGPRFENGMGLPLLNPEMLAINELQGMLKDDFAIKALNKAREKAEELFKQFMQRKQLEQDRKQALEEVGFDANNG